MTARESELVELVSDTGEAVGAATVAAAHTAPGQLHRAFSVLLTDPEGRFLLQRRAAVKTRFAGCWGNACCGHPAPGVDVAAAAARRLVEELGVAVTELTEVGVYRYRATDAGTGRVEHEYDHVLVGHVPAGTTFTPDPAEVSDVRWMPLPELHRTIAAEPAAYVPWLPGVLAVWPEGAVSTESSGAR